MKSLKNKRYGTGLMRALWLMVGALFVCGAAVSFAARPRDDDWQRSADRRKADYIYLRAADAFGADDNDAALMMMQRAAEINPHDTALQAQYGTMLLALTDNPDSLTTDLAYRKMVDGWEANQTDYVSGTQLATVARALRDYDRCIRIWSTLDRMFPAKTEPAVNLAECYLLRYMSKMDSADFDRAIAIYNRLENAAGPDLGLVSQKARAYSLRSDTAAVMAEIDRLLRAMPNETSAWLYAGAVYDTYGNDSVTERYYRHAAEIDSTDGRAFQQLADFYRKRNDSIAYDREVFNALQSANLDFGTKYDIMRGFLTELYADSLQWPRIEHLFDVLDRVNPGEPGMHQLYGVFELTRNDFEAAREQFGYTVALNPTDGESTETLIRLDFALDRHSDVVADSRRAMEVFPDNLYFPIMAATSLEQLDSLPAAIELLQSVDISDVRNKKAVSNFVTVVGDVYYKAGMRDSAFTQYERAIALDGENFGCYNNCAYFMAESDTALDKAERYAQYAVLSDPHNPTYLDTYAWVYFKKRDYASARAKIDEVLDAYGYPRPGGPVYYDVDTVAVEPDTLSRLPEEAGELYDGLPVAEPDTVEEAIEEVEEVIAPYGEISAEVLSHAGDIYFMVGEPDPALKFWEAALELEPDDELLQRKVKHKTYFYK